MKSLTNKKILVTGASGFVGQNLVSRLESFGANVYGLAETVDLRDFEQIKGAFLKFNPEIVFHLGALVDLSRDFGVSTLCVDVNIKGTLNVLEACRLAGVKKIIFPSSYEVYGDGKIPYLEATPVNPPSIYSITKLAGESMCDLYQRLYGLNYIILRISNVYGFGQSSARLIPNAILKALAGNDIEISGNNKRDFLYIEDLLQAFYFAIKNNLCDNRIINIGSGKSVGILDVVKIIAKVSKSNAKIIVNPSAKRVGESEEMVLGISLAKEILGWTPQHSLVQGLEKTTEYYKNKVLS